MQGLLAPVHQRANVGIWGVEQMESCKRLLSKQGDCKVMRYCTDGLEAYEAPKGGDMLSKAEDMHEAVTKLYIRHLNAGDHLLVNDNLFCCKAEKSAVESVCFISHSSVASITSEENI